MDDLFPPSDNGDSGNPHGNADTRGRLLTAIDATNYILAGKSTITLVSTKTEKRFTYRVNANEDKTAYFVNLLSGPDNTADYRYLGRIAVSVGGHRFIAGRKTAKINDVSADAPSSIAFGWSWRRLILNQMPDGLEIWHESFCGRCGRKLTVPSSVSQGFGPECVTKIGM